MSSSAVRAGLALVNKWAAISCDIQISLSFDGVATATLEGALTLEGKRLLVTGNKGEALADLSFVADARNVITEEGLTRAGLSPEAYSESVTFVLSVGEITLTALPRLRPGKPN